MTPKSTRWARENPEKAAEQQRRTRNTLRGAANSKVSSARQRAKNKGLTFDIDIDYIVGLFEDQEGVCPLTGYEMVYRADKGTPEVFYSFSIDRIDSSKGYTKDNIQLICWGANQIKGTMTMDTLFEFVKDIYEQNDLGEIE